MTNLLSTIRGIQPSFQLSSGRFSQNTLSFEIAQLNSTSVSFRNLLSDIPAATSTSLTPSRAARTATACSCARRSTRRSPATSARLGDGEPDRRQCHGCRAEPVDPRHRPQRRLDPLRADRHGAWLASRQGARRRQPGAAGGVVDAALDAPRQHRRGPAGQLRHRRPDHADRRRGRRLAAVLETRPSPSSGASSPATPMGRSRACSRPS